MDTLLVIGRDPGLLRRIGEFAAAAGVELASSTSVYDALTLTVASKLFPRLVIVDAECCDERTGPAFLALRARMRSPFVVVFDPASGPTARALPSDALGVKPMETELLTRFVRLRMSTGVGPGA